MGKYWNCPRCGRLSGLNEPIDSVCWRCKMKTKDDTVVRDVRLVVAAVLLILVLGFSVVMGLLVMGLHYV